MMNNNPGSWIGVDLDGTLAVYDGFKGPDVIGEPIPRMVERVKEWLAQGQYVKIMTARVYRQHNADVFQTSQTDLAILAIQAWCEQHIGQRLEVTCIKDYQMIELWDDRAVQVIPNTGIALRDELATERDRPRCCCGECP